MKVLLVNGSPHKQGCTHRALTEIATALEHEGIDSEIFWIGAKPAAGCMACGRCRETGAPAQQRPSTTCRSSSPSPTCPS